MCRYDGHQNLLHANVLHANYETQDSSNRCDEIGLTSLQDLRPQHSIVSDLCFVGSKLCLKIFISLLLTGICAQSLAPYLSRKTCSNQHVRHVCFSLCRLHRWYHKDGWCGLCCRRLWCELKLDNSRKWCGLRRRWFSNKFNMHFGR
jgi:hypothetical protein